MSGDACRGRSYSRLILGSTILMMKSKKKLMATTKTDTVRTIPWTTRKSLELIARIKRVAKTRDLQQVLRR